ncbi:unnamed protein product [Soboliphyme baturini]|uniref:Transposase n=1 Tax=Soboliphyme baturini TaxID=241478 RepID=A0A183IS06_9BILA|nr:unnamed protein product [Soboliphyme baturini]
MFLPGEKGFFVKDFAKIKLPDTIQLKVRLRMTAVHSPAVHRSSCPPKRGADPVASTSAMFGVVTWSPGV